MSNSNGHATAISDEPISPGQSLETTKLMNERTMSDAVMEDDGEQTTDGSVQDPPSAANPDLITIANTDVLTVPWTELKATAKDRLLEVLYRIKQAQNLVWLSITPFIDHRTRSH
jgi:hypothetical protein